MNIPVGRIIRTDMGDDKWGMVLYMVINPPIICETCNGIVFGWKSSEQQVICPDCGNIINERNYYVCPICGQNDYHSLRIVNNNNWHYDYSTNQVTEYCDKKGILFNCCGKSLIKDINQHKVILCSAIQSQDIKRKIVWTSCDEYDSIKQMPQWIIDKFPYNGQE